MGTGKSKVDLKLVKVSMDMHRQLLYEAAHNLEHDLWSKEETVKYLYALAKQPIET